MKQQLVIGNMYRAKNKSAFFALHQAITRFYEFDIKFHIIWDDPDYHDEWTDKINNLECNLTSYSKEQLNQYCLNQGINQDMINGFLNENLEKLTFADNSFDLFICLDVLEHINYPERVFQELYRTIKPGGTILFTVPTYKDLLESKRRALYNDDGTVDFLGFEPEYHGNPVNANGSLVTFHYGYDLPQLIKQWCGLDTWVYCFHDKSNGIIGEFTEVYLLKKLV